MTALHRSMVTAVAVAVLALVTACNDDANDQSLEITNPKDGAAVSGNVVELALDVSGIEIVPTKDDPGDGDTGHFSVFIDRDPMAPGEAIPSGEPDIVHTAANPVELTGLSVGPHRFVVVLSDNGNKRIGDAAAETSVRVDGPSVDVTGPTTAEVGRVIQVEIAVQGIELIEEETDASNKDGSAGQLVVFVNKDPTSPGDTVPTDDPAVIHTTSRSVAFPADLFKEGQNTIWVMLGYADGTPLDPRVLDKIDVEVS